MKDQNGTPDLFSDPIDPSDVRARKTDPKTSHEAAEYARRGLNRRAYLVLQEFARGKMYSQRQLDYQVKDHPDLVEMAPNSRRRIVTTLEKNFLLEVVTDADGQVVTEKDLGRIGSRLYGITGLGKTYLLHNTLPPR